MKGMGLALRPCLCLSGLLIFILGSLRASLAVGDRDGGRVALLRGNSAPDFDLSRAVQLSASPILVKFDAFLSDQECQHLIMSAKIRVDPPEGKPQARATILRKYQDALTRRIEDRISQWIFLPRKWPNSTKVMRYTQGQQFDVHYAFYSNPRHDSRKGSKAALVLLFLSDVDKGGEIVFPDAKFDPGTAAAAQADATANPTACNSKGLAVRPKKGTALFLHLLNPNATRNPASNFHKCPVESGERWMAVKGLAVQRYSRKRDPNDCENEHEMCDHWAGAGECTRNSKYMVGVEGTQFLGHCRKACKVCSPKK